MTRHHLLFLLAVTVASFGQIFLKAAARRNGSSVLRQYLNGYVALGYFLMLCSMGMVSVAYRGMPLKVGPALDSLGFVLVPLLSYLYFDEKITWAKGVGLLLIVCGVLILIS